MAELAARTTASRRTMGSIGPHCRGLFAKLPIMQTLLTGAEAGIPLWLATDAAYAGLLDALPPVQSAWARAQGFAAERHRLLVLPDGAGRVAGALLGLGPLRSADELSLWDAAPLPERLPAGTYRLATA